MPFSLERGASSCFDRDEMEMMEWDDDGMGEEIVTVIWAQFSFQGDFPLLVTAFQISYVTFFNLPPFQVIIEPNASRSL
jgi:hypothetical protein